MKALSIRQPWAYAILHAGKRVENRSWSTRFRGEFFIHASKGCGVDEMIDAIREIEASLRHSEARARLTGPLTPRDLAQAPRGGIVGRARLVDVLPPTPNPTVPWHMPGQYGFVLEDVVALPFRKVRGALGFFEVFDEAGPR